MTPPRSISIREVGPREGFQTIPLIIDTSKKLELICSLNKTGVKTIEIASFVRPDRLPQMADAEEIVKSYERIVGVEYWGLYLNENGFERAEAAGRLDNRAWLHTAASETFLKRNSNKTWDEVAAAVPNWMTLFKRAGRELHGLMLSTAFGCSYEGRGVSKLVPTVIETMVLKAAESGAKFHEIWLADTVGLGNPQLIRETVDAVRRKWPGITISLHLHDTHGSGIANAYAGIEAGVSLFDASVGGMGGCPFTQGGSGNIATEELIWLCEEVGIETGLSLDRYIESARLAEAICGKQLHGKLHRMR